MKEEILFKQLKDYLTKEYMRLSDERDDLLRKKVQFEVEKEKEENPLFDNKKSVEIKKLFSSFSDLTFDESFSKYKRNSTESKKIEELENTVNQYDLTMEEIRSYISFVQNQESLWIKSFIEPEIVEETEEPVVEISTEIKEMITDAIEFLKSQYPQVHFKLDLGEKEYLTTYDVNSNVIRIITYAISSTLESIDIDTIAMDLKKRKDKMVLSMLMMNHGEIKNHYIYKFALL